MEGTSRPQYGWAIKRVSLGVVIAGLMLYLFMYTYTDRLKGIYWKQDSLDPGLSYEEIHFQKKYLDDGYAAQIQRSNVSKPNGTMLLSGQAQVMLARRRRVMETCARLNIKADVFDTRSRFLINEPLKLAMCSVPKAGCTYWKRVFIMLEERQKSNTSAVDVFGLTKYKTHTMPQVKLKNFAKFDVAYDILTKATRIIFTRDPYSRLYSGYIDKFFLGDFWAFAKSIIKSQRVNASEISSRCGHDLTFEEFLRHAVTIAQNANISGYDSHWFPVVKLCKPCTFNFDIIGTQESFSADRDYIQSELGITASLNLTLSPEDVARDGIKQNIITYWNKATHGPKSCISRLDMTRRMWKSFQIQGYIDEAIPLPENQLTNIDKDKLLSLAMKAYRSNVLSSAEKKQQRRNIMVQAYKTIPTDLMQQIRASFSLDFELFGYPVFPEDLYTSGQPQNGSTIKTT